MTKGIRRLPRGTPTYLRYFLYVDFSGGFDTCWPWKGSCIGPRGPNRQYGQFSEEGGVYVAAHRYGYEHWFGPIPEGKKVLHKCDFPPCQNPTHWFLGNNKDNTQDMLAKDRFHIKLSQAQVLAIREETKHWGKYPPRGRATEVCQKYAISPSMLWNIRRNKNWKHI